MTDPTPTLPPTPDPSQSAMAELRLGRFRESMRQVADALAQIDEPVAWDDEDEGEGE